MASSWSINNGDASGNASSHPPQNNRWKPQSTSIETMLRTGNTNNAQNAIMSSYYPSQQQQHVYDTQQQAWRPLSAATIPPPPPLPPPLHHHQSFPYFPQQHQQQQQQQQQQQAAVTWNAATNTTSTVPPPPPPPPPPPRSTVTAKTPTETPQSQWSFHPASSQEAVMTPSQWSLYSQQGTASLPQSHTHVATAATTYCPHQSPQDMEESEDSEPNDKEPPPPPPPLSQVQPPQTAQTEQPTVPPPSSSSPVALLALQGKKNRTKRKRLRNKKRQLPKEKVALATNGTTVLPRSKSQAAKKVIELRVDDEKTFSKVIDVVIPNKQEDVLQGHNDKLYAVERKNVKLPTKRKQPSVNLPLSDEQQPLNDTPIVIAMHHKPTSMSSTIDDGQPILWTRREQVTEALEQAKLELQRAQQLTTANRKQVLKQTKAKLKEAQEKFQALVQRESLPPITALLRQDNLVLQNISGPDELVRFHSYGNDDELETMRQQATEFATSQTAKAKSERLQMLKEKLSKLKSRQSLNKKKARIANKLENRNEKELTVDGSGSEHQDGSSLLPSNDEGEGMSDCTNNVAENKKGLVSKEDLMKRQEELQAKMDIAYWKKLVAQQKKLLEEQQQKVRRIEHELQECDNAVQEETKGLQECNDTISRWPILDEMIVNATRQVLSTRNALRKAKASEQSNSQEVKDST